MPVAEVLTDMVLVHTTQAATVHASIDKVDVSDWLLNLPDAEYRRCAPPDHIAAGSTTTDDGQPMSINVEEVGGALVISHPTGAFLDMLEAAGQTFEEAAAGLQKAVAEHNQRETPLFAASLEGKARTAAASQIAPMTAVIP